MGKRIIAVISHQRSGTHFLGSCIGSHPAIKYTGEIFWGEKTPLTTGQMWKTLDRVMCGRVEVVCLDTKYNQLSQPVRGLLAQDEVKVIHLIRRNALRLYFSGELHTWRGRNPGNAEIPVLQFSEARFNSTAQEIERYKLALGYLADVTMYYEDLTSDRPTYQLPDWASEQLCELAGVAYMPMTTDTKKNAPVDFLQHLTGVPERLVREFAG